uniref:Manganese-dependent ADP-ribose/CDP-alcohol diphosphatase n=1 Tax=Lygus hesperus TaxID=30085 RepID=A0A0A9WIA0_LYGHE
MDVNHPAHGSPNDPSSEFGKFAQAVQIINANNPNVYTEPTSNWMTDLPPDKLCFIPYNGAYGREQLVWLERELQQVQHENQRAIIAAHVPLDKRCSSRSTVAWDASDVLNILHKYASHIIICLYGHFHKGGYCVDEYGLHHYTPPAPIECETDTAAFAHLDIYPDRLDVCGVGVLRSFSIPLHRPL